MLLEHNFIDLFQKFIKAAENGRRLKKNGHRITGNTIKNYYNTLRLLHDFILKKKLI
jgi:hypothetical protein